MSRNEAFDDGLEEAPERRTSNGHWPDHYNPKPGELDAVWPTVRTQTYVDMVFGVIKEKGQCTQREIIEGTQLPKDKVGVALADLMLWRKTVKTEEDIDGQRLYSVSE